MAGNLTAMIASIFSGSTVTPDPYYEYTTLLLPGNGTNGAQNNTFLDASTNNFTITRNGNTTQGTFSPFSQTGWSGSFNTSTTYLTVTDTSNLRFGSSNFTIEAFVYRAASGATQTIASKGASTPTGWVFQISSADKLVFTDTSTSITGATSLAANTWYYVAVVRAGTGSNQTTLYVNAVSDATGTSATTFSQTDNMKIGADRSNTNFANGYISNLRLSNTNRTISSTPTSALDADSNTIFLGLFNNRFQYTDSTAAFTNMTVTGTPSVQAFSPFNPTSSWSATTNGGSGYFDGNGDYLQLADSTAWDLSGDYTIEMWINVSAISSSPTFFQIGSSSLFWYISSATKYLTTAGSLSMTASTAITLNSWNHIAICRSGSSTNNTKMYLNGVKVAETTNTTSFTGDGSNGLRIGAEYPSNYYLNGYISNLRVVNGTAVYTADFTPPTSPLTAITNTSLLLNFTNAGIYDATSKNDLETVGNAQLSTAQSKWGGSSIYMAAATANTDYLVTPASRNVQLGSGDFTIEFWMRPDSVTTSWANGSLATMLDLDPGAGTGTDWWFIHQVNNTLQFGTNGAAILTSSASLVATTWQYIALVRSGSGSNNLTFYINGSSSGSATYTTTIGGNRRLFIGTQNGSTRWYKGYIQDLRITPGVARPTTTPTAAFPTL